MGNIKTCDTTFFWEITVHLRYNDHILLVFFACSEFLSVLIPASSLASPLQEVATCTRLISDFSNLRFGSKDQLGISLISILISFVHVVFTCYITLSLFIRNNFTGITWARGLTLCSTSCVKNSCLRSTLLFVCKSHITLINNKD